MEIYVDGDACPVKAEVLRVAERLREVVLRVAVGVDAFEVVRYPVRVDDPEADGEHDLVAEIVAV